MLPTQQTIQFSNYSDLYDLIVPHENILRRINDLVDFSFIQKELICDTDTIVRCISLETQGTKCVCKNNTRSWYVLII